MKRGGWRVRGRGLRRLHVFFFCSSFRDAPRTARIPSLSLAQPTHRWRCSHPAGEGACERSRGAGGAGRGGRRATTGRRPGGRRGEQGRHGVCVCGVLRYWTVGLPGEVSQLPPLVCVWACVRVCGRVAHAASFVRVRVKGHHPAERNNFLSHFHFSLEPARYVSGTSHSRTRPGPQVILIDRLVIDRRANSQGTCLASQNLFHRPLALRNIRFARRRSCFPFLRLTQAPGHDILHLSPHNSLAQIAHYIYSGVL